MLVLTGCATSSDGLVAERSDLDSLVFAARQPLLMEIDRLKNLPDYPKECTKAVRLKQSPAPIVQSSDHWSMVAAKYKLAKTESDSRLSTQSRLQQRKLDACHKWYQNLLANRKG